MAYDKYYSKEEITKRLRLKLKPKQTSLLDKFRELSKGGNGRKGRLLSLGR